MNSVVTAYPDALPEATSTSLTLPESLTFEQWEQIGAELANRARKLNWWIGDWWAAGHHRYGERARLAAKGLFGKEFKTLANIASVCRAFDPSRRREDLSWSHHAEAAALSPNAADMLLDLAERDRMSKAQVRAAVTTIRGGPAARSAPDEAAVAGLFRSYNRLPGEVRMLVAQAFAAANGAEIDPTTGEPRADVPAVDAGAEAAMAAASVEADAAPSPDPEAEAALGAETAEVDAETQALSSALTELDTGAWPGEVEFDAFDLGPELETAPDEAGADIALDLAAEMEVPRAEIVPEPAFDLASELEAPPAVPGGDAAFDLTMDLAAQQGEEAAAPFDLAAAMEALPDDGRAEETSDASSETALDLELDMAVEPSEASDAAFDLEAAMELIPGGGEPLDLGAAMEKKEEDEDVPSSQVEPWLQP